MPKKSTNNKPKIKKTRVKDERERREVFENIATALLQENTNHSSKQLEVYCKDLIEKNFSLIRNDLNIMESSMSAKLSTFETKINYIGNKLDDFQNEFNQKINIHKLELEKVTNSFFNSLESERGKRLNLAKKINTKDEQNLKDLKILIMQTAQDSGNAINNVDNDLKLQVKEIIRLRDNFDEM
jgi:hypothetical protein